MIEYTEYLAFWTPGPLNIGKSLTEFKRGVHEAEEAKDELMNDVKKVKDEVVKETKDAAGLDDTDNN
ncbi:MAG: hypothetical protein ACYSR6_05180 [Planctomycetota bacterium]|jgi:hypothetical protein